MRSRPVTGPRPVARWAASAVVAALAVLGGGWVAPASAVPNGAPPAGPTTGTVEGWGDGTSGQLAVPAGVGEVSAVAGGGFFTLVVKADGTVEGWGDNYFGQTVPPSNLSGVVQVSAGEGHSVARRSDGTVVAWGDDSSGQATVPAGLTGVVDIAAGQYFTIAAKSDGTVVAWGDNASHQVDVPVGLAGVVAVTATEDTSFALKSDGTVVAWGDSAHGLTTVPGGLSNVTALDGGAAHVLALKSDGTVVGWGQNSSQEATPPAGLTGVVAVAGHAYHSSALKADGTVVQWGSNHNNQATVPAGLSHVVALAGGLYHALVIVQSPPVLTADAPPTTATTTAPYAYTFAATGTPAPTFAVSAGSLPPGLSLSSSGQLAGTATTPGTYTFSVRASNGVSPAATGASHTVTVPAAPAAPGAPRTVLAQAGVSQIVVSWQPPSSGAAVDHYLVQLQPGGASCTTSALTCILGAAAGSAPTVTVVAVSASGLGGPAGSASAATVPAPVIAAQPPQTDLLLTTDQGRITRVVVGQDLVVIGEGFLPYSTAVIVIHSTPVELGRVEMGADGRFSRPVTIPTLAAGDHVLVASGVDPGGAPHHMRMDVTVRAADRALASTGVEMAPTAIAGSVLLAAGAALVLGSRRRRP